MSHWYPRCSANMGGANPLAPSPFASAGKVISKDEFPQTKPLRGDVWTNERLEKNGQSVDSLA